MSAGTMELLEMQPAAAARELSRSADPEWLASFVRSLELGPAHLALARVLKLWGLSQSRAAELFGVSRQAFGKWLQRGLPADRLDAAANLAAATDILVHYLKPDRIPAVGRRPSQRLGGRSLVELVGERRTGDVLAACRRMFDFDGVEGA